MATKKQKKDQSNPTTEPGEWTPPKLISIDIKKAKITKDDTLHIEFLENYDDLTHSDISKDCDQLVHPDLTEAFNRLIPHLVILCDQKHDTRADQYLSGVRGDEELEWLTDEYKVTGFSISGDDGQHGVTIIGRKIIDSKVLNLVSPFENLASEYQWIQDLNTRIDVCKNEVQLYLNGKAAIKQAALDFDDPDGKIQDVPFEEEAAEEAGS